MMCSFWVYGGANTNQANIFNIRVNGLGFLWVSVNGDGTQATLNFYNGSTTQLGPVSLVAGQWNHVLFSVNNGSWYSYSYVNGVKVDTKNNIFGTVTISSWADIYIGNFAGGTANNHYLDQPISNLAIILNPPLDQYNEPDVTAFRTADGKPVDLTSTPYGTPILYLKGGGADCTVNSGSGGNFLSLAGGTASDATAP